ncbi:MAG: ferredoxin [Pseudomonadota bacterium]
MSDLPGIEASARTHGLGVVGAFHPGPEDGAPEGAGTILLLGPDGPDMWGVFSVSPEYWDGAPDPMDRWSERVIEAVALEHGGEALFPFRGPPWAPFQRWAERGEGAVQSPVAMQATPGRGLWTSYRGALALARRIPLPRRDAAPCAPCGAPCRTACPVGAFSEGAYDTDLCASHMRSPEGAACRTGCLVRLACPAGTALNLPEPQRKFHMDAFLNARP